MNINHFLNDNIRNNVTSSTFKEKVKRGPCWMGIDEAGRGPVLGAMVYGTCFSPISVKEDLIAMDLADSKQLTEEKRDEIFKLIDNSPDLIGWMVEFISPTFISNSMLKRSKYNLNAISHDCAIRLIRSTLEAGVNVTEIYIDTVGDPNKYQHKLQNIFPDLSITVAKKADSIYPIVSAASICAKVARDKALNNWKFNNGTVQHSSIIGSGYPSDPVTKKYMADSIDAVFGYHQIVRFSWSTASQILDKRAVPVHWNDDEDEVSVKKATPSVFSYFSLEKSPAKQHVFFSNGCLHSLSCL